MIVGSIIAPLPNRSIPTTCLGGKFSMFHQELIVGIGLHLLTVQDTTSLSGFVAPVYILLAQAQAQQAQQAQQVQQAQQAQQVQQAQQAQHEAQQAQLARQQGQAQSQDEGMGIQEVIIASHGCFSHLV